MGLQYTVDTARDRNPRIASSRGVLGGKEASPGIWGQPSRERACQRDFTVKCRFLRRSCNGLPSGQLSQASTSRRLGFTFALLLRLRFSLLSQSRSAGKFSSSFVKMSAIRRIFSRDTLM